MKYCRSSTRKASEDQGDLHVEVRTLLEENSHIAGNKQTPG